MGKIKRYSEFFNLSEEENVDNPLGQRGGSSLNTSVTRKLTKIVSGGSRNIRSKTSQEILEKHPNRTFGEWDPKLNGFVGYSYLLNGKVLAQVINDDDEEDLYRYEILSGLNSGLKGEYSIDSEGITIFSSPFKKEWKDLKGPDKDFLSNCYNNFNWKSPLGGLESKGIEIKTRNESGECYIEYDDIYQFFGKVEIYCETPGEEYVYEVKSGTNKGKKGSGLYIRSEASDSSKQFFKGAGVPRIFWAEGSESPSLIPGESVDWHASADETSIKMGSYKRGSSTIDCTGINPRQIIFLNTSDQKTINSPIKEDFLKNYGSFSSFKKWVPKTELENKNIIAYTWKELDPMKGNKWNGYFETNFLENPMYLYQVNSKNPEDSSLVFDWKKEDVGRYTTNFFVGLFIYTPKGESGSEEQDLVKGEWYWDYDRNSIGIIYAYDRQGKEVEIILNPKVISAEAERKVIQHQKQEKEKKRKEYEEADKQSGGDYRGIF
jgi:hypothetical protein